VSEPVVERPAYDGRRTYDGDNPYGHGFTPAGDPSKGGRPRKTPAGNKDTEKRELVPFRAEVMERARARLYERSALALDEPTLNSIVQLVVDGNYPTVAAKSLGVSEHTYQGWMTRGEEMIRTGEPSESDPDALQAELFLRVEEAEARFETATVSEMRDRIEGNKMWAGHMTVLERRFPSRWGRRDVSAANDDGFEAKMRAFLAGADARSNIVVPD
jgi:transposase